MSEGLETNVIHVNFKNCWNIDSVAYMLDLTPEELVAQLVDLQWITQDRQPIDGAAEQGFVRLVDSRSYDAFPEEEEAQFIEAHITRKGLDYLESL